MSEKLNVYFGNKGIKNSFIKKIIEGYIADHIRCFGEKITEDMIIERLEENLNAVKMIKCETSDYRLSNTQVATKYNGFEGIISLYVIADLIKDSTYKEYVRSTMYHSLTHAVYFNKDGARGDIAQEIFGIIERNEINKNIITLKNDEFVEAVTNFISTKMTGRENGKYVYETKMMNKLASLLDSNEIIESAWSSNNELFKKALQPLNRENAYRLLGYCFRLCKYNINFLDVAASRFNDLVNSTNIPKMPVDKTPSKSINVIAAYKINDLVYAEQIIKEMSNKDRQLLNTEIKTTPLLTEREKETFFDSIAREK